MLELNHSTSTIGNQNYASVDEFITPDLLIEVIPGWTLETLFQESLDSMELVADSNASRADWVYLIKDASEQIGDNSDYIPYFHDETAWRLVDSPQESLTEKVIQPQDSVIIARHTEFKHHPTHKRNRSGDTGFVGSTRDRRCSVGRQPLSHELEIVRFNRQWNDHR